MSYDTYLTTKDGLGDEHVLIEVGDCTSNVSPMWFEAIGHSLADMDHTIAASAAPALEAAVKVMKAEPDRFRAMNPPNGWGDYEGALAYLERLLDGCRRWPDAVIRVSR